MILLLELVGVHAVHNIIPYPFFFCPYSLLATWRPHLQCIFGIIWKYVIYLTYYFPQPFMSVQIAFTSIKSNTWLIPNHKMHILYLLHSCELFSVRSLNYTVSYIRDVKLILVRGPHTAQFTLKWDGAQK